MSSRSSLIDRGMRGLSGAPGRDRIAIVRSNGTPKFLEHFTSDVVLEASVITCCCAAVEEVAAFFACFVSPWLVVSTAALMLSDAALFTLPAEVRAQTLREDVDRLQNQVQAPRARVRAPKGTVSNLESYLINPCEGSRLDALIPGKPAGEPANSVKPVPQ
jgi:hypothetical protein